MATPYITIGCPTSGGGQVISGNNMFLIDGIPVACVGDKATCPTHKVVATIVSGDPCMQIFGKAAARVNDSLSCGCKLLPQQNLVVQDNGGAASSGAKSSSAPISQKQPATDSFVKDEYENYYIEQNTTKYVKFTNGIFPYDEDKKNLFGAISQAVSGVCTFIVTYILKGQELFVTVSMLPPTLSGDATIFPYATLDLVHNNQSLGKTRLEKGKGVWSTENSKEPVGQCKVTLPKPDLSTIEATLTMGYTAKFDGGTVRPNPPHTRFSFTLNSASRRKS
ncbi:PAAR domain-containing protein [Acinetobacter baumannii]|uniref:PAAR domain-containing protein n=1 Tax=Acinetobacter baumannii TaxID=470 RepID=UPI0009A5374F|nr:PAAR domain-containing protein [Acinetobacter baumannii]MCG9239656.1 PAAR domain-containing protein [Acinetobacter baumannii]MCZ3066648.1 PAAR domain-containing protein [Acinetobacter baumannii]MDC5427787.1 PAAR domain-containing protein [Acinetobacter baumannii]MDV4319350.1 PAAR domain-containing protein [Acinetobacter baumannii]MDY7408567.1 PAAR domain-containing protein [Acinetobacter baumannii]